MKKSAFTLFELMIVVLIIGIVYALVLNNFNNQKSVKILKIKELKDSLKPLWRKGKRVDLVVYDDCKKAAIVINQEEINTSYKPKIKLLEFQNIQAYTVDRDSQLKLIEFPPLIIDNQLHSVCFRFTIFKNGSSSSYILKHQNGTYYIFYPYFEDVNESEDESEAIDMLKHKEYLGVDINEAK